jgi:hypothetical protein
MALCAGPRLPGGRRHSTTDHEHRIRVAWDDVSEVLARSGVVPRRSETPNEFAARAARAAKLDPDLLTALAERTTIARYAPREVAVIDEETLATTLAAARHVERQVRRSFDRRARMRELLDPRPATARRA